MKLGPIEINFGNRNARREVEDVREKIHNGVERGLEKLQGKDLDYNGDGKVSKSEKAAFDIADRDNNNKLGRLNGERGFREDMDKNGDELFSSAELSAGRRGTLKLERDDKEPAKRSARKDDDKEGPSFGERLKGLFDKGAEKVKEKREDIHERVAKTKEEGRGLWDKLTDRDGDGKRFEFGDDKQDDKKHIASEQRPRRMNSQQQAGFVMSKADGIGAFNVDDGKVTPKEFAAILDKNPEYAQVLKNAGINTEQTYALPTSGPEKGGHGRA